MTSIPLVKDWRPHGIAQDAAVGEAKRRGTREQRVAAATEAAMAAAAVQRAADLESEKAQQEAEQASRAQRFDTKDGRTLLVRSARSGLAPSRDDALLMVALAAALEPAGDTSAATPPTKRSRR